MLRHNDRKTYFFNDISSVVDGFCFPSTYSMLLSPYVSPTLSLKICYCKNMFFCHCVYKIYDRSFAFYVLKNYVIERLCLYVLLSKKVFLMDFKMPLYTCSLPCLRA